MPARILVVDDEPQFERLILQRLRKKVRSGDYEFLFAQNGIEALEVVQEEPNLDMVLTDINMPRMDGLTLIGKLKEIRPTLKVVIVSAYGDMKNIRTAMNLGAFDFVTKPIEFTDLETTITKTLEEAAMIQQAAMAKELGEKNEQLQELDQLKSQFFTNISHEFRTPLTVIRGMAEQMEENPEKWTAKGIQLIQRNTSNLLDLVNQILDLRKLESKSIPLNYIQSDIFSYVHYIVESFQSYAETKDIQLNFYKEMDSLVMDYDPEKFLRIASNLLDNALKYTPAGGQVDLIIAQKEQQFSLEIKDTGVGIASEELPYVFDRFFQTDKTTGSSQMGTGIGLSLVQELVKLLDGEISVESIEQQGSSFKVLLPISNTAPKASPSLDATISFPKKDQANTIQVTPPSGEGTDLPSLLIIEDNPDVAAYLVSCLEGHYQLMLAEDGQVGIDKALESIPDIIISDVMMPKKDGFEVCQTLKTDTKTSHIPIILLTAKADAASKIEGLERGADAYLAKPFDKKELFIRLEKLLELREKLQARYSSLDGLEASSEEIPQYEDEFITQIRETIMANLDDTEFGILELCRAVAMSRTQLHRKIKALTDRSTSSFIRSIRLNKAKELLATTHLNISQVAYEVGFKDPKYFSRTFAEEYGESPNQMRK